MAMRDRQLCLPWLCIVLVISPGLLSGMATPPLPHSPPPSQDRKMLSCNAGSMACMNPERQSMNYAVHVLQLPVVAQDMSERLR